ncbi:MAG: hypothetical protein KGL90_13160 [Burkholderiales bacterium]|nr:hypothetical protein [Burkholderiales bacterium]
MSTLHLSKVMKNPPLSVAALLIVAVIGLCGLFDYVTGYEVSVFVVYLLPIGLAMRYFGTGGGVVVAFICSAAWIVADLQAGHPYHQSWVVYWNGLNRLVFFLCAVAGIHHTQATLAANRRRLQAFSGPLPICSQCRNIGSPDGHWRDFESYICEHGGAVAVPKVCPDCARKAYASAGTAQVIAQR